MTRILGHLRSNLVAYVALFVALGGTSYAAVRLPAGSVGNRQLKNHSVTPIKLDRRSIAGYVHDWIEISNQGQIIASRPRARLLGWTNGGGIIQWSESIPAACFALATTTAQGLTASYASATAGGTTNRAHAQTAVEVSAPGTSVNVAIICPQP